MWHSSPGFCLRNPPIWIRAGSSVLMDQPPRTEAAFSFFDFTPTQTLDRTGARSFFVTIRSFSRLAFRLPT
jgi:hypothetical protein